MRDFTNRGPGWAALVVLTAIALAVPSIAQVTTATIYGRVEDPSGAVIPGASVDVIEPDDSFPPADWGFVSKIEADGSVYLAGPSWGVRTDSDNSTFVDPTIMTTEHCYQHYSNPTSWAYVRILSDLEIAAAHGEGTCPATMPTDSIIYYR